MIPRLLAGLDIGTTGCKLSVFSEDGEFLGKVYRDYPASRTSSTQEIDANTIWASVREALREGAASYPGIAGIGVTSFGETFVALDDSGGVLMPSMLYTDPRGEEQCEALTEALSRKRVAEITGLNPHAMYSLPKLMWLKEKRPDVYAKTRMVMQMGEYIVYKLTGVRQVDYSLATRTLAFDIRQMTWSQELLSQAGIDPGLFSRPVPSGAAAGKILPKWTDLGLDPDAIIVSIAHDQVAAAVGSGVLDDTYTVDGAGTVECLTPVFSAWDTDAMADGNYCVVPFVTPGTYVTYAFSYTGGALVQWFVEELAGKASAQAAKAQTDIHALLERNANDGPTGLLVLPHFAGAATPYMDIGSRGAIVGLSLATTERQIYTACMEGVCYEMRLNQDRLQSAGIALKPLRATGGGAKSRAWLQMKADILNLPVTSLEIPEAGGAGSAMLTGVQLGVCSSLNEASQKMVHTRETFYPRPEMHRLYDAVYQKYKQLYDAVRQLV